jgi:hypothetical protein
MGLDAVPVAVDAMLAISSSTSWKARISVLEFLQVGKKLDSRCQCCGSETIFSDPDSDPIFVRVLDSDPDFL